jgi:ubiquitin carboxyl-terminal hydrolase 7
MHRGGTGAGHYFAYLRPTLEDKWYEFNDSVVTPVLKSTAMSCAYGGDETFFNLKELGVTESVRSNNTSAYMLIYIRDHERSEILKTVTKNDIPKELRERFDEENSLTFKLDRD